MNKKQKIFIFTINMGSGGAERVISIIIPKLMQTYDVSLVVFNYQQHYKLPDNLDIIQLNNNKLNTSLKKIFSFLICLIKYIKLLKKNKVDLSISFLTRPNIINGICKIFVPKTKIIISERCFPSIAYKSYKLRLFLYKILIPMFYNKADALFSNSLYINEDLKNNFNVKIPMSVIYNPVIISDKKINVTEKDTINIINVGSMSPVKNQQLILRALINCQINYKIMFVGDGIKREYLKNLSKELKIEKNVFFAGRVSDVNNYLLQNDCFILSSNYEGFPNVILEALSCGLTVISTNCTSGPLELLNCNNKVFIPMEEFVIVEYGILININDDVALYKAIDYVSKNKDFRKIMREKGIKRAKQYNVDMFINNLKKITNENSHSSK